MNEVKNNCCFQVSPLIIPPQEQGIFSKYFASTAAEYKVNTIIVNTDVYKPIKTVLSSNKKMAINISNGGSSQIILFDSCFGIGWLCMS